MDEPIKLECNMLVVILVVSAIFTVLVTLELWTVMSKKDRREYFRDMLWKMYCAIVFNFGVSIGLCVLGVQAWRWLHV